MTLRDTEKQVPKNLLWRIQQIHLAPKGGGSKHPSGGPHPNSGLCPPGQQRCMCVQWGSYKE